MKLNILYFALTLNIYESFLLPISKSLKFGRRFHSKSTTIDDDSDDNLFTVHELNVANREENTILMNSTRIEFVEIDNISTDKLINELEVEGVARINSLLTESESKELLSYITHQLAIAKGFVGDDLTIANDFFAVSKAQENRWDLKLPMSDLISCTLKKLLCEGSLLGDSLNLILGANGKIAELAAFVTIEGASRQIMHSDTFWSVKPALFTITIALQDIDVSMGPTCFIPKTHTEGSYLTRLTEFMEEDIDKDTQLLNMPHYLSLLETGSAAIYDSRLLHCGGANRSTRSRVLFYFTVANPVDENDEFLIEDPEGILDDGFAIKMKEKSESDASIRESNRGGYILSDFR